MIETNDTLRQDQAALLAALQKAGADTSNPSAIRCPFHEDRNPSGGVYADDAGVWRFKCHAGSCGFCGDLYDVQAKLAGRPVADVLRERHGDHLRQAVKPKPTYATIDAIRAIVPGEAEATYVYTNPETESPELIVIRFRHRDTGKKAFWQARPVNGGFMLEAPPKPWPLYNRGRVAKADTVVVVEGEKAVHALHALGIVATTSPAGAGAAKYADWTPLAGKTVVLWSDHDDAGIAHMKDVARMLDRIDPAPRVSWIDPQMLDLPDKGDAVDYIAGLPSSQDDAKRLAVELMIADAEPVGASREVWQLIEDTISGKRSALPWPWPQMARLTKALLPGTVTILAGDPGASKSFMLLEAAAFWHGSGIRTAVYELEDELKDHLYRALAQAQGDSRLFDDEWVRANPDDAREAWAMRADFLDSFGRCLWVAADKLIDLPALSKWVSDRAVAGYRVIAIDPITAVGKGNTSWEDDLRFMIEAKAAIRNTGASLVLVTHPRKGRKTAVGLDELSGGAAYARFAHTIMWLESPKTPKSVTVHKKMGRLATDINRVLHVIKSRNAGGHGQSVGCTFDGQTLRLIEHGVIAPESEHNDQPETPY